ncbi:Type I restriction modification DNA specificity domain [uncultured Coprococcus sp.]|uniref:restriction endonuclease subunit S n=1 Tax=Coprococcus ammoniilyticus TaxID=2981785 RepID=UPI0008227282|nr:restriction endonuclease subunit S [Coprococcus ammoniilyticus]MCU6731422.1 restriction endonuclease subunit S [Coprococcus ammoniilyticus]SCI12512.1 Type I restriction modification DNA specificity domain [uncultured Coprococcus sp.]
MGLTKYKFGELIELTNEKNANGLYGEDDAIGVNIDKIIMPMRGNLEKKDFSNFHLVPPRHFAYNPRGSRKLGIGFNDTEKTFIITFNDNVFRIKETAKKKILDTYLFMYLCRKEWDRYAEFISWGSSTEVFDWNIFCEEEIFLPPIQIQQKYVDVYNAMLENQKSYERGLDDIKLVCDAYTEDLRREMPCEAIGSYIEEVNQKNIGNLKLDSVRGIATSKEFINTKANMEGVSLENYKVVEPGMIAFISDTSRRADKMSIALNQSEENYLVSSISTVIQTDNTKLLPKYLYLFFCRTEFDRYARFHSWGSARETFSLDDMKEVRMPLPTIDVQKSIVGIYEAYTIRKEINEKLKAQIKDICPILIKGSIEEATKAKEA